MIFIYFLISVLAVALLMVSFLIGFASGAKAMAKRWTRSGKGAFD